MEKLREDDKALTILEMQVLEEKRREANQATRAREAAERQEQWLLGIVDETVKLNDSLTEALPRVNKIVEVVTSMMNGQPLAGSVNELTEEIRRSNQRIEDHMNLMFQILRFVLSYVPASKSEEKKIVGDFLKDLEIVDRDATVESIKKQIQLYVATLNKLKEQEAKSGGMPSVELVMRIEEVEHTIANLKEELRALLPYQPKGDPQ